MLEFKRYSELIRDRLAEHRDLITRRDSGEVVHPFLPTGLATWDKNGGIVLGVATCIAGATGEGKSAVKLQLMRAVAQSGVGDVGCFELEDPAGRTVDRSFARETGKSAKEIGRLEFNVDFLAQLEAARRNLEPWADRVLVHCGLVSPAEVKEALEGPLSNCKLVMLDYAQGLGTKDLEAVIADIAWHLNRWAQVRNAAVIIFSQTTAEVEKRGKATWDREKTVDGYRPSGKSDIKWSSALAERCKQLVYIFRPGNWARKHGEAVKDDVMELIFDKSNFGETGSIKLRWIGAETRLEEMR